MAISGHHSKASHRNYIGHSSSEKKERALISFPMRWAESHINHCGRVLWCCHPERSSCSSEFGCRSLKKKLALNSLFSILSCEKIRVFLRAIIWLKFIEHFTSRFCIRDLKTSSESVKFDLPNYLVCKLSQIVNIDGFLTLMIWHFWQLLSCTANPIIWTILTGILIGLL